MTRRTVTAVFLAAITGWFWRIGIETWPTWQPVMFLAGMVILFALCELPTRGGKREDA